jgi:hypothetical protein
MALPDEGFRFSFPQINLKSGKAGEIFVIEVAAAGDRKGS